ncbi:hypothetical protein [Pseudacidovorax intermedius]|uniref:hypothetical protein n=1 Tax=Pseudacidovorax intermedius TaxID=433924 RepID=UPI0026EEFB6A|nr:hypothetical protein [Pseudacidovorax intermedius]
MNWLRLAGYGLLFALLAALGLAVRSHWISIGEGRVQARWDTQKRADAEAALADAQRRNLDLLRQVRNTERIADEDNARAAERQLRDAVARNELDRLQRTIAELKRRQLPRPGDEAGIAALAREGATARELLGRCGGRYADVAAAAEGLRDQVTGLQAFVKDVCRAPGVDGS